MAHQRERPWLLALKSDLTLVISVQAHESLVLPSRLGRPSESA